MATAPLLLTLQQSCPLPEPSNGVSSKFQHKIHFRHPGYPDDSRNNVLLSLFAFDHPNGGLHYSTAFLACAIIAGNAWGGYLTDTRGGTKLAIADDDLLTGSDYWFYVPTEVHQAVDAQQAGQNPTTSSETHKYPIIPAFCHWQFPHDDLPKGWRETSRTRLEDQDLAPPSATNQTAYVLARDGSCRISLHKDYIECAHLCPRNEKPWFTRNRLDDYNRKANLGDFIMDDISNAIALRSDLHTAFDDRRFLLTRKASQWVVHFLELTNELGGQYHNRSVSLHGVSPEFILVRFAWAIFPLLRAFLEVGSSRRLRVMVKEGDNFVEKVADFKGQEVKDLGRNDNLRDPTPNKRSKRAYNGDGEPTDDDNLQGRKRRNHTSEDYDECRGRKRYRTSSPWAHTISPIGRKSSSTNSITKSSSSNSTTKSSPVNSTTSSTLAPDDNKGGLTDFNRKQRDMIKLQRPNNPQLICCDYSEAERRSRLGLPGKKEQGGAYLCLECMGEEYQDELSPLPAEWAEKA